MKQPIIFFKGAVSGTDQYLWLTFGIALGGFIIWWLARTTLVIGHFLKAGREVLGVEDARRPPWLDFLASREIRGVYKGRDIYIGVSYSGIKNIFLPLPRVCMTLKETTGYNTGRLTQYAAIENNTLVFLPKVSLALGVFDKGFEKVFSKNYLIMALEKMIATAEDLERGHPLKEVFS
ncbi:ATP-dependent permease AUS1 [Candidatus Velamenicoccus archaeovorus]|uniref:ATP-dependent permease AUS1 n=1 Tax=Velamenicoccus archaeovorus TaxID=1930593 RepID=A0A410P5G0_VELA1|nr:hypothetical protein [Candidatus Velamenicoccus archaeovorus]QAT17328.1 ATP-dependent permease AUS1 [Candidatus Velamenicoccus archaeovorus]